LYDRPEVIGANPAWPTPTMATRSPMAAGSLAKGKARPDGR
jgi:hypothetical protein